MVKIFLLMFTAGVLSASSQLFTMNKDSSNAFFRANSSVAFVGSDEIIGVNESVSGVLSVNDGVINGGEITILANCFDTQNRRRDKHIAEILNVKIHPKIIYYIQEQFNKDGESFLRGLLSINGIEKTQDIRVVVEIGDVEASVKGKFNIKYSDFGIETPTFGGFIKKADDEIEIGGRFVFVKE